MAQKVWKDVKGGGEGLDWWAASGRLQPAAGLRWQWKRQWVANSLILDNLPKALGKCFQTGKKKKTKKKKTPSVFVSCSAELWVSQLSTQKWLEEHCGMSSGASSDFSLNVRKISESGSATEDIHVETLHIILLPVPTAVAYSLDLGLQVCFTVTLGANMQTNNLNSINIDYSHLCFYFEVPPYPISFLRSVHSMMYSWAGCKQTVHQDDLHH